MLSNPSSKEWNKYGGFLKGPRHQGTGHFRVEKIDGKWWFLDPDGYLFWSNGVNSAGRLKFLHQLKIANIFLNFCLVETIPFIENNIKEMNSISVI